MTLNLRPALDGRLAGLALLGAAHALSFAPGPLPPWALPYVQIFSLAILAYHALRAPSVGAAARDGFAFGFGNFACGLYWLYISMHFYGGMALPLAISAVVLLALALALYSAGATALGRWLAGRQTAAGHGAGRQVLTAAAWASGWTLLEWLRGTLFTGFPWLNIGYAHIEGVLAPWAPIVGVYGVAWLAAFAAAAIALLACAKDTKNDAKAAVGVGLAVVSGLAGIGLGHVAWTKAQDAPLIIRLVQGNIPQSEKFDPARMAQGIAAYLELAALPPKTPEGAPALIVLPETVMPLFQDSIAPATWQRWLDVAALRNAGILMGVPLRDQRGGAARHTNSAIAFDASTPLSALVQAAPPQRYDKHHLVPFGEFIPPGFRWFVDAMSIPLGDFDRGAVRQPVFQIGAQRIAPDICYEDVFGEEIIRSVRDDDVHGPGATILVNLSNLAWFGDSWSLRQHLQISRMRALETGRPMIRSTNTGMTAAIDPTGRVRAMLEPQRIGVLDVEVQGMTGATPYVKWGNGPILAFSLLLIALALFRRGRAPQAA
ncbi:apolipoprotein N-acyltransferase [Parapusillimonas granuli]|uniref:Apolipoprotein N-acyltransferase n=1 Tax=Parapusillimonas granuli TaxID=380911 RepID=A0A853FU66_9BURK|nr:apolipoprotein N-acyltransferase [Parapusillimonas granuli]MBB5215176.1 apolipoprotein N-acyltransferase [Parapusillimonas granuli]MEB2401830.1 apolipoprotein N-acyltransferase [Alcaligenaceae bacterium]NYT49494.1 apolipoprotein N-acyltransferase [Parapusillimonas granuli]